MRLASSFSDEHQVKSILWVLLEVSIEDSTLLAPTAGTRSSMAGVYTALDIYVLRVLHLCPTRIFRGPHREFQSILAVHLEVVRLLFCMADRYQVPSTGYQVLDTAHIRSSSGY